MNQEVMMEQVVPDAKKHVKTEKLIIGKTLKEVRDKPKKGSMVEAKTSINLNKITHTERQKG